MRAHRSCSILVGVYRRPSPGTGHQGIGSGISNFSRVETTSHARCNDTGGGGGGEAPRLRLDHQSASGEEAGADVGEPGRGEGRGHHVRCTCRSMRPAPDPHLVDRLLKAVTEPRISRRSCTAASAKSSSSALAGQAD